MSAGFQWIKLARENAQRCANRGDAHVLLYLATRANANGEAWPSLATIARECGLRVKDNNAKGSSSAISESLKRLRTAGLIQTTRRGAGQSSVHRLTLVTSGLAEVSTSGLAEQNYQENCHTTNAGGATDACGATSRSPKNENQQLSTESYTKGLPVSRTSPGTDFASPTRHRGRRWTEAELDAFIAAEDEAA